MSDLPCSKRFLYLPFRANLPPKTIAKEVRTMDVEKTIQFLLEQQARFDTRQAQSEERMAQIESVLLDVATAQQNTNAILTALTERHVELEQSHEALSEAQRVTEWNLTAFSQATERNLSALSEAQRVTEQNLTAFSQATERNLSALSEAQRVTAQSLNALIGTVERHIASHK
jgi:predicted  nucleic acid-binding Zn-ribbon protein